MVSQGRKIGTLFLLVLGCILVVIAIVTGSLMAEREARFVGLQATVSRLESGIQTPFEGTLGHDAAGQRRAPAPPQ